MYRNTRVWEAPHAVKKRKKLEEEKTLANTFQVSQLLAKYRFFFIWAVILSKGTEPEARSPYKTLALHVRTAGEGTVVYAIVS